MPLADQRAAIARLLQNRRQSRVIRRQTDLSRGARAQRLFEPDCQAILVSPGDDRDTRGGTNRGIGVGLRETHAFGSEMVDVWRREIPAPVARHVGIAKIVGEDEHNVRLRRCHTSSSSLLRSRPRPRFAKVSKSYCMRARSAARHPGHGCDSAISYDDGSPRYPRVALPRSIEIIVSMYNINYAMSPRCAWDRAAKQRKTA